jgi:hypothetical protein
MMPRHVPPQYRRSFGSHGALVDPSDLANLSVMTWYIDLDLQSFVKAARVEPEREKRSEVSRHIDGWIMMKASQSEASAHRGAAEAGRKI